MKNILRERMETGEPIYGTFVTITDPAMVELVALAGFDYAIIEMEHAGMNLETMQNHLRAAQARGIGSLVRVPVNEEHEILRVLESGADGVFVPHVATREDAERAVRGARYAPLGGRGIYDNTRAGDFSAHGLGGYKEYTDAANRNVVLVVLIEDKEGVENAEAIAAVPGIDVIVLGPADLSYSIGQPGSVGHPEIGAAIKRVRAACKANGVRFCVPPQHVCYPIPTDELHATGQTFFFRGSDVYAALEGLRSRLGMMKSSVRA
jgi:4-hydroxy-2-oxoheptanedioate aldolase